MTSLTATASASAGPLKRATPSRIDPKVQGMESALNQSGPATPRTPESRPKRMSKISPVSSNATGESPSGASPRSRNSAKFVTSTSTGRGPAFTYVMLALGTSCHTLRASWTAATAAALSRGPRLPRSGLNGTLEPPPGHSTGTPLPHLRTGPPASAERADENPTTRAQTKAQRRRVSIMAGLTRVRPARGCCSRGLRRGQGRRPTGARPAGPPSGRRARRWRTR